MTDLPSPATLAATALIDSDHPDVIALARQHAQGVTDRERAVSLYLAVRDQFRYDPYRIELSTEGMRASSVIAQGSGWCVPKAALMAAACRAAARLAGAGYTCHHASRSQSSVRFSACPAGAYRAGRAFL